MSLEPFECSSPLIQKLNVFSDWVTDEYRTLQRLTWGVDKRLLSPPPPQFRASPGGPSLPQGHSQAWGRGAP
eukprot:1465223-Alexandrium_andersonii.AAC.1